MKRAFKYRIYPNKTQEHIAGILLDGACGLYNAGLEQRRDEWRGRQKSICYFNQSSQLKEARDADHRLRLLNYGCCQDVLLRLQRAFDAFFRRIKRGETPGYPRFKSHERYDSITFPVYGDGVKLGRHLRIQNVGDVKIKLHRPVEGRIKTVTIKREAGKWYAIFSCDGVHARTYPAASGEIGIDVGLGSFAALSTGEKFGNPRWYRKTEKKLAEAHRKLSSKQKRSRRRKKARERLSRLHARAANQRRDFHHKLARRIVAENRLIAVEDLAPKEMAERSSRGMAKSIHDAGWGRFLAILSGKAEEAGRTLVKVPPRGTSSVCYRCGAYKKKALSERTHACPCGLELDRDLHASLNILRLGRSLQRSTG